MVQQPIVQAEVAVVLKQTDHVVLEELAVAVVETLLVQQILAVVVVVVLLLLFPVLVKQVVLASLLCDI
jgi:hypothetical protein